MLLGEKANIKVRDHDSSLCQTERQLPHKACAPAQQGAPGHGPGNIVFREDVQNRIQKDPAHHERQQIPHRPAGKELLPEIGGRVGQPQQKTARDLDGLADGAGQIAEGFVMDQKMQHTGEQCGIKIGLQQGLELLVDTLADRALAEAVATGNEERSHQAFAVDIREKSGQGQTAETLQRVKFCCVGKYDGQHSGTLQHVEHADGADSAGLGSFHEQGPSLRLTPCSRSRRNVVELIKKTRVFEISIMHFVQAVNFDLRPCRRKDPAFLIKRIA